MKVFLDRPNIIHFN